MMRLLEARSTYALSFRMVRCRHRHNICWNFLPYRHIRRSKKFISWHREGWACGHKHDYGMTEKGTERRDNTNGGSRLNRYPTKGKKIARRIRCKDEARTCPSSGVKEGQNNLVVPPVYYYYMTNNKISATGVSYFSPEDVGNILQGFG